MYFMYYYIIKVFQNIYYLFAYQDFINNLNFLKYYANIISSKRGNRKTS